MSSGSTDTKTPEGAYKSFPAVYSKLKSAEKKKEWVKGLGPYFRLIDKSDWKHFAGYLERLDGARNKLTNTNEALFLKDGAPQLVTFKWVYVLPEGLRFYKSARDQGKLKVNRFTAAQLQSVKGFIDKGRNFFDLVKLHMDRATDAEKKSAMAVFEKDFRSLSNEEVLEKFGVVDGTKYRWVYVFPAGLEFIEKNCGSSPQKPAKKKKKQPKKPAPKPQTRNGPSAAPRGRGGAAARGGRGAASARTARPASARGGASAATGSRGGSGAAGRGNSSRGRGGGPGRGGAVAASDKDQKSVPQKKADEKKPAPAEKKEKIMLSDKEFQNYKKLIRKLSQGRKDADADEKKVLRDVINAVKKAMRGGVPYPNAVMEVPEKWRPSPSDG